MRCGEVQSKVFGERREGHREVAEERGGERDTAEGSEEESDDEEGGVKLPTTMNPTSTNKPSPSIESLEREHLSPQARGIQTARQREQVRQAARRGVAFGFVVARDGDGLGGLIGGSDGMGEVGRRKVEAVQNGRVVEASFAKGEWAVRWRE